MGLESLLLSRDQQCIAVLRSTLEKLSIRLEVCRGARSGHEILCSEKFDAVIIDCDDLEGGLETLQDLRKTPSNKNSVAFAILNGKSTTTRQAFEMGANFVLQKPVSPINAMRCFSAAFGLMEREQRRYFRQPVQLPATVTFGSGQPFKVTATNVSDGGMAISFRGKLPKGRLSMVSFTLPGMSGPMEPKADLAWVDDSHRAGLRFRDMPTSSRQQLEKWISEQKSKAAAAPVEESSTAGPVPCVAGE